MKSRGWITNVISMRDLILLWRYLQEKNYVIADFEECAELWRRVPISERQKLFKLQLRKMKELLAIFWAMTLRYLIVGPAYRTTWYRNLEDWHFLCRETPNMIRWEQTTHVECLQLFRLQFLPTTKSFKIKTLKTIILSFLYT